MKKARGNDTPGGAPRGGAPVGGKGQTTSLFNFFQVKAKGVGDAGAGEVKLVGLQALQKSWLGQVQSQLTKLRKELDGIVGVVDESSKRGPKSQENVAKIKIVEEALKIARTNYGDEYFGVTLEDLIVRYPAESLLLEAGGQKYVSVANGGTKGAPVVEDIEDGDEPLSHSSKMNKMIHIIMMNLAHKWDRHGNHIGFADVVEYRADCKRLIGYEPKKSTAYRHLLNEKTRYEQGFGMRKQSRIDVLAACYEDIKRSYMLFTQEPTDNPPTTGGAPFFIKTEWYADIITSIEELETVKGFNPSMVIPVVADVVREKSRGDVVGDDDDEDNNIPADWEPSYSWVTWFMRDKMQYRFRRVETARKDELVEKEIRRFHDINLDKLRQRLADGMKKADLISSDQFGLLINPADDRVWARKGQDAAGDGKEDKRQITGNFFLRGDGSVLRLELTFPGRSVRSLPSPAVQDKYKKKFADLAPSNKGKPVELVLNFTPNHWSNQEKTIEAIEHVGDLLRREQDGQEARPVVYSLDSWPVNRTADTADAITKFIPHSKRWPSRFIIPAKGTGSVQVNDTHAHAPFKKEYKYSYNSWFGERIIRWRKKRAEGKIDAARYKKEVSDLLSWPVLRDKMLEFVYDATVKLLQPRDYNGVTSTVIGKGFDEHYWDYLDNPDWIRGSDERKEELRKSATLERERLIANMGVANADKTQEERDAAMSRIPSVEDIIAGNYDRADKELAEGEEQHHLSEVPKVKKAQRKTGQKRPNSSKIARRRRAGDAIDDAEAEVNDAVATGMDPKDRKKAKMPKQAAKRATKRSSAGAAAAASKHDTTDSGSSSSDDDENYSRKAGSSNTRTQGKCPPREEESEGDEDEDEDDDSDSDSDSAEPMELVERRDVLLDDANLIAPPVPAADDDQRPALQIGQRVKVSADSVVHAFENWRGLTMDSSKGPTLNAVHGVIRLQRGRQYMVQWFGDECEKKLYACTSARIYALLDSEWDRDVEKRYNPIEK